MIGPIAIFYRHFGVLCLAFKRLGYGSTSSFRIRFWSSVLTGIRDLGITHRYNFSLASKALLLWRMEDFIVTWSIRYNASEAAAGERRWSQNVTSTITFLDF